MAATTTVERTTVERPAGRQTGWKTSVTPLLIDVGVPVATYYVAKEAFDTSMVSALIASSIASLATMAYGLVRDRRLQAMSVLVLCVNVVSIGLSFMSGNVRVVSGKDAIVSSVIGLGVLLSVLRGRPALAEGLRPFVTKGHADRDAAWDRLATTSPRFRHFVAVHSVVFGAAFVADCAVRVVCAAVAPLSVLGWIGTAATIAALVVASIVSGALTVEPLEKMVIAGKA